MGYHSRCRPESAMRVQAQLTPCEYSEYPTEREYRMRPRREYAGSITRPPERPIPSGHSDAHSADATAFTSALRFRAARSPAAANATGTTADAAPGTPPAHAGTPSTLPGTVPRGISVGIPCDVGTRPGLGMHRLSAGGDRAACPCGSRQGGHSAYSCGTQGSHASTHSTASTPSTQRAHDGPRRGPAALLPNVNEYSQSARAHSEYRKCRCEYSQYSNACAAKPPRAHARARLPVRTYDANCRCAGTAAAAAGRGSGRHGRTAAHRRCEYSQYPVTSTQSTTVSTQKYPMCVLKSTPRVHSKVPHRCMATQRRARQVVSVRFAVTRPCACARGARTCAVNPLHALCPTAAERPRCASVPS